MHNAKVSAIIPVYNVEQYLNKCITSILNQTYTDLEIILVDDGSTDRSSDICEELKARDSRIHVIHKANGGLSDARNAGMDVATGEWYAFIDSDDFITPDTIARLYDAATQLQCPLAVCNMVRIYEDDSTEGFYQPVRTQTLWDGQDRFLTLRQPSVCNKLFRRELFEGVRFPKGKFYEDTFVYHILVHRAGRVALTGHDGYYYLSRKESILGKPRFTDRYFDFVEAVHLRAEYLISNQVPYYGTEACLSLYAALSAAEKHIPATDANAEKFRLAREWYAEAYGHLRKCPDIGLKQRVRLMLLRYFPKLHTKLF